MKVFAPCFSLIFGFLIFVSPTVLHAQDITIDDEGDDAGNIELRIKYAYVQYKIPDYLIFTDSHLKFGITQRPWIDFEEHINAYRKQQIFSFEKHTLLSVIPKLVVGLFSLHTHRKRRG